MLNVLLPVAGSSTHFDPKLYPYPTPFIEVSGRPIVEHVVENYLQLGQDLRFIFVVRNDDCRRFHLDNALALLAPGRTEIIRLTGDTAGALCSALMAVSLIDNEEQLVIANSDQLIANLASHFKMLQSPGVDAGCLCFESIHPRWSYVRIQDGLVVEAAEKNPISKNAIAGFYYFKEGRRFVQAAKKTILSQRLTNDRFYIAPVFNELILEGCKVNAHMLSGGAYTSFFTPQRIEEFERQGGKV